MLESFQRQGPYGEGVAKSMRSLKNLSLICFCFLCACHKNLILYTTATESRHSDNTFKDTLTCKNISHFCRAATVVYLINQFIVKIIEMFENSKIKQSQVPRDVSFTVK